MSKPASGLVENRGQWQFPVAGGEVTQVQIDYTFGIVIETHGNDAATTHIRISTALEFERTGEVLVIDPEDTASMAPLITLHKATVAQAYAIKDGHLVIRFADAGEIRVAPHADYEAWAVSGESPPIERRFSVIAVPSGGLAVF